MHFMSETITCILYPTAIISACQSIIWICLTICAILTFRCVLPMPSYESDSFIFTTIVKLWFQGNECKIKEETPGYPDVHTLKLMEPGDVFSWMTGYLTISLANLTVSILLVIYKSKEQLRAILSTWCFVTFFISIMDVILTILFVLDYVEINGYVENHLENHAENKELMMLPPTFMFLLSARGFVLWLINVALLVYFIVWLTKPLQEKFQDKTNTTPPEPYIQGYDNFAFQNAPNDNVVTPGNWYETDRGAVAERKLYPRRLSVSSFEAVTPFNKEEYSPGPSRKFEPSPTIRDILKPGAPCYCARNHNSPSSGGHYHSHACPSLMSELEQKIRTLKTSDRPREKAKTLEDFSHDIKNFRQGSGRRENKAQNPPKRPAPVATNCPNSSFY